jgi:hypothetical protein
MPGKHAKKHSQYDGSAAGSLSGASVLVLLQCRVPAQVYHHSPPLLPYTHHPLVLLPRWLLHPAASSGTFVQVGCACLSLQGCAGVSWTGGLHLLLNIQAHPVLAGLEVPVAAGNHMWAPVVLLTLVPMVQEQLPPGHAIFQITEPQ